MCCDVLIGQGVEFECAAYAYATDTTPIDDTLYTLTITLPNETEVDLPNSTATAMRLDTLNRVYVIKYTPPVVGDYKWYWRLTAMTDVSDDAAKKGEFTVVGR